ncbi:diaminohydroxyphosphoribosylaminopyrimidine deaminase [Abditibacterium utsteinense]|uniref:Riboflavin biosynthesis protein RibD n=1 Tax=Abditibacterium utsteinense TaxID=1960156 RepID=A0A2S8SVQ0_9BACT|nr:bifunctional diaminohydroxyphosphoribosylaminopyrimidine deaminase/5-amino-6-(5-phosphoribosylamino)uracil reductase RibD [Abditibacterium utsteinense]PQV64869.1 diaminohydroxyphosphoribosylaminopyrimidine deaminase [Abditibacterium utsteinense]
MKSTKNWPDDEKWMREALKWSYRGKGWTSPRPSVGAVIVKDGHVLGGGHTQTGDGTPHAEVMALRQTRDNGFDSRGASAYVTLEPCSHFATTPPCCDTLIAAGISRVVTGVIDPNPLVAGRGLQKMRAAGIEVREGVLERECARAQDDFLHHIRHQSPFVTLKSAVSLDGKIALNNGQSKWITGEKSREKAHLLRHYHDAVLVGIETVLADNPRLDVRLEGRWKQPVRVVLDSSGRLPLNARIWENAPQLIVATCRATPQKMKELRDNGATVLEIEPNSNGEMGWKSLLDALYAAGIYSILVEGGARVAGSALRSGIVQKASFFVAPLFIGAGKSALSGFEIDDLKAAPRLRDVVSEQLGDDLWIEGTLEN